MTENCDRLKVVRRAHRGVVTKLTREVDTILGEESATSEQISRLSVIYEQLENKLQMLQGIDQKILTLCSLEEVEGEIEESEAVLAKLMEYKRRVSAVVRVPTPSPPTTAVTTARITTPTAPGIAAPTTRLPKLTIAKFRGEVTDWTSFWDSFKSAIHENREISQVNKFNYLYSLLEGAALRTIKGLSLTEDNYDTAIELLQKRFGNTQQIVAAHVEELLKLPPCNSDCASSLRFLYDKVIVHTRGLNSLGVEMRQYGSILIPVLMSKLPSEVRLRVAREQEEEVWDINDLMKIIQREVEARESSEGTHLHLMRSPASGRLPHPNQPSNPNSSASALVAQHQSVRCVYCAGNHFSASCSIVKDAKARKTILMRTGRCFNCLKSNHKSKDCDSRKTCRYCRRRHHQSICEHPVNANATPNVNPVTPNPPAQDPPAQNPQSQAVTTSSCNKIPNNQTVLLQTARAIAISAHGTVPIRALLDNGSQLSYITTTLQSKLKLEPIRREKLHLNTFGSDTFATRTCDVVHLSLQGPGRSDTIEITACTSPTICSSLPTLVDVTKYAHLTDLELADHCDEQSNGPIDVLIGSNYYWSVVTSEMVKGDSGPVAVNSIFGWLLSGPVNRVDYSSINHTHVVITDAMDGAPTDQQDNLLSKALKRFWDSETIGIHDSTTDEASNLFLPEINFDGTRYEVSLPWKDEHPDIPDHLHLCYERLKYLHQRLLRKPNILQEYNNIITEQLNRGIIEVVSNSDVPTEGEPSRQSPFHYLPHHAVIRQDKQTTKVRIVYDGSAKSTSTSFSLNDCLMTGPNLIPKLFNILVKFRWNIVAVTADIEKAFLMISIRPSDRDMLRFLWFNNPEQADSKVTHFKFTRLVFGLRPSPAILSCVISHHLRKYHKKYPELVQSIESSLYVDDLIAGEDTVERAFNLYAKAKGFMADGNFNLRKWNSNSTELLR